MQRLPLFHHDVAHDAPLHETPYTPDYDARFQVKPRVRRSFSFEELQSGSCFQSMDEYDLQFYRIYGQPVYIPPADDSLDGVAHLGGLASLHYPYQQQQPSSGSSHRPPPYKSYALAGSLGDSTIHTPTHPQPSVPTHSYGHGSQHPGAPSSVHMAYSSSFASDHLAGGTAPAFEPLSASQYTSINAPYTPVSNSTPVPPAVNGTDPLIDHITYLPSPMQCASPVQEEPGQSTPFGHAPPLQQPSQPLHTSSAPVSNGWIDTAPQSHITVPSQAYPDHPIQDTPKSDYVQTSRHQTKSPSPRAQQARGSMISQHHSKGRSLDKKPALACLFCRGRKIACGPPLPGSKDKTCNQCARRHLKCEYPLESRRGMRKRRATVPRTGSATPPSPPSASAANATSGSNRLKREKSPEGLPPAKCKGRKRSTEKRA